MKGLILSGGKGSRMKPITHTAAKQLFPIANKPILLYAIDALKEAGVDDIGIVVNPETGDDIRKVAGEGYTYITQDQPLGLAHAVKTAKSFLGDSNFIMFLGDNLIKDSLKPFVEGFTNEAAFLLLKEVENPSSFGVATLNEAGDLVMLQEKPLEPLSNLALVGVYIFDKWIHHAIDRIVPSQRGELEITDAIQWLLDHEHDIKCHKLESWWLDTGKKDDMLEANRVILDEMPSGANEGVLADSYTSIKGRVTIGEGTSIIDCEIRGPVIIGKNCMLEGSFIGSYTSIGNNSVVRNSKIQHSIIRDNCSITDVDKFIDSSLMGSNVRIKRGLGFHNLMLGDDSILELTT